MIEHDVLQRFIFENKQIRGEIVRLQTSYKAALDRHAYPLPILKWLGQALSAISLLTATIKFSGKITLQVQTNKTSNLLVVQCNDQFNVRGLAKWDESWLDHSFAEAFADGYLAITIAPTHGEHYQGLVALNGKDLAGSIKDYFYQSEQLPTHLYLFANENVALGLLIQAMPGTKEENHEAFWQSLIQSAEQLSETNIFSLSNEEIIQHMSQGETMRIFDSVPVKFHCDCTIERMENAIRVFGYEETHDILKTNKYVTVTCEFCHYQYDFEAKDVARIFAIEHLENESIRH